jgi:anti-sigma-K factor RskA
VTDTDPFRYDDGPYVLGALAPDERAAFEAHLATCSDCTARVSEVQGVPGLLAGIDPAEFADVPVDPMPDTLLPRLMREARRHHRRQRLLIGGLAAVAAACVLALVVALWPSTSSTGTQRSFVPVAQSPVSATATLTPKSWGTAIDVHCHYLSGSIDRAWHYKLVAYDRGGNPHDLGDWALPPDKDIDYQAGTALPPNDISRLDITLPDGTPVLRLTT